MKLPLRSIRPASQPSGKCHCSISLGNAGLHDRWRVQAAACPALHRHFDGDDRLLHEAADEGRWKSALDRFRWRARCSSMPVWMSERQWLPGGRAEVDELLAVLVGQHDPAAGQTRPRRARPRGGTRRDRPPPAPATPPAYAPTAICLLSSASTAFTSVRVENRMASRWSHARCRRAARRCPRSAARTAAPPRARPASGGDGCSSLCASFRLDPEKSSAASAGSYAAAENGERRMPNSPTPANSPA